jgi:hypothetical protein
MAATDPAFENGWSVPDHDYQAHTGATATHGPTSVVYKKGGASGKLMATETLTYDGNGNVATRSIAWESDVYM